MSVATPYSFVSTADDNRTLIIGRAGTLRGLHVSNINAAVRYIKFWDAATAAAVTVGTTTPYLRFVIPGNAAGAGLDTILPMSGVEFTLGIVFALVTGAADSSSTGVSASEHVGNIYYN